MVHHKVDYNFNTPLVCFCNQLFKIVHCAVFLVDPSVVGYIIAVVAWRWVDRHQPNSGYPEVRSGGGVTVVQIIQLIYQPSDIPDSVAVGIIEASDEDFVEDSVVPPVARQLWESNTSLKKKENEKGGK